LKPVFVRKELRDTIADKELQEQIELERLQNQQIRLEQQRNATHDMVIETILKDKQKPEDES